MELYKSEKGVYYIHNYIPTRFFDYFSEEEWKKTFEIERKKTELRHPEDFE